MKGKGFFIDLSKCTACRGCQVACKQWNKLSAEPTHNAGSYQNPPEVSFNTYKTVHFEEIVSDKGELENWLFFPEQCRHCLDSPCKSAADIYDDGAIVIDENSGAVIFTEKTAKADFSEVLGNCPYNIPRQDKETKQLAKCTLCVDRITAGLVPACVLSCNTGTMNYGDLEDMRALAKKRLAEIKPKYPEAQLGDADNVRVIYLYHRAPNKFYENAISSLEPLPFGRKELFAKLISPMKKLRG